MRLHPDMAHRRAARLLVTFGLLSAGGLAQAQAQAQDGAPAASDTWRFQVTPYVWMTGLQGDVRPARGFPTARVSQSFSDVLSDLDAAAFLNGTARRAHHVIQLDATYAALSESADLPLGLKARANVTQQSLTLTGGRNWTLSPQDSVDVMAGVRGWNIRAKVQAQPLGQVQSEASFVDPIVAVRWRRQFDPRWSTLVHADAGGLGVGSEFTWQLMAAVNGQIREDIYLSIGYRHLHVNHRGDGRVLDFGLGGPVLGATFRF